MSGLLQQAVSAQAQARPEATALVFKDERLSYGALEAGIRFLPTTMVIAVIAPIAGRLADRLGPATPMSAGLAVLGVSMFLFAGVNTGTTYAGLVVPFVLMGL